MLVFAAPREVELRRRGLRGGSHRLLDLPLEVAGRCDADVHVFSTDITAITPETRRHLPVSHLHLQHGGSFVARLTNAVSRLVAVGYDRIVIIGRDCPQLASSDCRRAIRLLDSRRVVIGPNARGGCYLIGIRAADVSLLEQVTWCAGVDAAQLSHLVFGDVARLRVLRDVHSASDIAQVMRVSRRCRRTVRPRAVRRPVVRIMPTRRIERAVAAPARAPPTVQR